MRGTSAGPEAVVLLKVCTKEELTGPEYVFQLSQLMLEARLAFATVRLETVDADAPVLPPTGDSRVLLVGPGAVVVGRRSLEALGAELDQGAPLAIPYALASTSYVHERQILTRRGFERAETDLLKASVPPAVPTQSQLPVCLFSAAEFARWISMYGAPAVLTDPGCADPAGVSERAAFTGLCHPFIDYYGEVRDDILPFVPRNAREVLEVGCGRGMTGALLQDQLGCLVTGVELNSVAAEDARHRLHRVLQGDVLEQDPGGDFDVVLALELFEHLTDGDAFLEWARRALAPGGLIIMSLPNVGYWSVVEDLLAGRWDYLPIGLLCFTHYRFFTRTTLEEWLRRCGFERFTVTPQTTPLPEVFAGNLNGLELDRESLSTTGFYVVVEVD